MDHLVSVHTVLTRTQKSRLRALSADRDTSMATLLRDAVDHYRRLVAGPPPELVRRAARGCGGALPPQRFPERPDGRGRPFGLARGGRLSR